ncbi:hypothetical protein ACQEVZ_04660 [Dactylosporangium sp. CA-152071]|uniref:hypothetical protein n=1 Tax=Dactylosporangium sp. CA-152071 TaxID=3239933 RepID=UPI003D8B92CA
MNDVKMLCDLALDDAPPLREAERVLAVAARAARTRDRVVAATAGLAGVTVAAALVAPALLPSRPTAPAPFVAVPAAQPTASQVASAAPVPSAQALPTHDRAVYDLLVAALPAGYSGHTQYPFAGPSTPAMRLDSPTGSALVVMSAHVVVSDGHGEGYLGAYLAQTSETVPPGGLCALPDAGRDCRVVDVAGVQVVVWLEDHGDGGDVIVARRYLQGGHFSVTAQRTVPVYPHDTATDRKPALDKAFLTADQVAALAGNPAMLP